jgi:enamine deaminase RidA (YjgF/YER057c/UK114 family)
MAGQIEKRLKELNIVLPQAPAPAANYVPWTVSGKIVFVAGQLPMAEGALRYAGKVGRDLDMEQGKAAARLVALNLIAQVKAAAGGDLDRVARCVKLGAFVQCPDGFADQPQVVNGASDLMVEVFGEAGKHARFAVGVNALPRNAAVEIDAIFELR